jgi:hypothetical protein
MTVAVLKEESPSVHAHLSLMQSVIQRMASNSTSCKAWCVTLVSAILVLVAEKDRAHYAWLALLPTLLFFALDVHYLALEKGFREAYNAFIDKLHQNSVGPADLYAIRVTGSMTGHVWEALQSFSTWPFYLTLLGMIYVAYAFVLQ